MSETEEVVEKRLERLEDGFEPVETQDGRSVSGRADYLSFPTTLATRFGREVLRSREHSFVNGFRTSVMVSVKR